MENNPTEAEKIGIDRAVSLSYKAIDESSLTFEKKRGLIFSIYSFRCLFDNAEMLYINPILKKYFCTFSCDLAEHPSYALYEDEFKLIEKEKSVFIPYGGLYVKDGTGYKVRFDAGSPLWQEFSALGKLPDAGRTVPDKFDLYDLFYNIISLSSADTELKAMTFITFPYAMLLGAPHDIGLFEKIQGLLYNADVFNKVLYSPYSLYIRDTVEELAASEVPPQVISFYAPYLEYKQEKDGQNRSREEVKLLAWLKDGKFNDVFLASEKLLDSFPDDDGFLICNIAARISLLNLTSDALKESLLTETVALIESALERGGSKKVFLYYYLGLAKLGLKDLSAAKDNFNLALEQDHDFTPAKVMQKALKDTE